MLNGEKRLCVQNTTCVGGACIPQFCSDSDGKISTSLGTTKEYTLGSLINTQTDACYSATKVREYYCASNKIASNLMACGTGKACLNGVCA